VSDAPRQHRRHRLERALGIFVSLIALAGVVYWALKQQAPTFPGDTGGWALIGAACAVYTAETLARGWRWHVILRHAEIEHQRRDAVGVTVVGYMGNTVLPARGGEFLRIIIMGERSGARRREVLGTIVPERLLDAGALALLFALITILGLQKTSIGPAAAVAAAVVAVVGGIALYAYHRLRGAGHFESFAERIRPVARGSRLLVTPWGAGLLLLTCGIWIAEGVTLTLCAQALDVSLSWAEAFATVVLASFFSLIPAAPGFVGTFDAAVIFGLKAAKVTGSAALSVLLMYRFVLFVPITIIGLILLLTRYGGFAVLRSAERDSEELSIDADLQQDDEAADARAPERVS
jgi:glycosyltransferase 2 family protein